MHKPGDTVRARNVGYMKGNRHLCYWIICPECRKGRWSMKSNIIRPGYLGRCLACYTNWPVWERVCCVLPR